LTNQNSFKFNGLVNPRAINIQPGKDNSLTFSMKSTKRSNLRKPATMYVTKTLKNHFRANARCISAETKHYRPDLRRAALARFSALARSAKKPVAKKVKKTRRGAAKK